MRSAVPDVVGKKSAVSSARQWRAKGVTPPLLRALVRDGQLVRVRHGVYATKRAVDWAGDDPARTHVLAVMAATATVGNDGTASIAVASYQSAARLHHLSLLTAPPAGQGKDVVTLTLPPDKRWNRAQPADVVFHASDLPRKHLTKVHNLPVTTVARTIVDLARTLPFMDGVVTADSALNQEKTTKRELRQVLDESKGWPGVKLARRVIDFADDRAESPLESAARVVFAEATPGLEAPDLQATIHGPEWSARVDFLWPERKVIAEADGLVKYNDRKDLLDERERDHQLREAGYTVVHFTWKELFQNRDDVTNRIRGALARSR
jgi:predicted transcriptional regulator of viral defense system